MSYWFSFLVKMKELVVFWVFMVALVFALIFIEETITKLFLAAVLVVGLAVYLSNYTIPVSWVEVKEGAPFVKLPSLTLVPSPSDFTVEWSRCAPEPMKVHEYQIDNNYPVRQNEFYSHRTNLEQHQLGIGDFSLTLRNPCFRDSGTYICTIHKNRNIYTQKVVQLEFKEGWWSWILRRAFRR
ncbi:hypothetical protein PFLUV_G00237780 [Perca fluviatilis]|uniref:Immunoglobulin V-set domain-containing protein n=1 Tax=Perca fluviatilis TaxID=8168 RepID=A0A6A5E826_PERFL|nr:hypothetical protein PFLUV_G00237780 [Perca fluviatilis]